MQTNTTTGYEVDLGWRTRMGLKQKNFAKNGAGIRVEE